MLQLAIYIIIATNRKTDYLKNRQNLSFKISLNFQQISVALISEVYALFKTRKVLKIKQNGFISLFNKRRHFLGETLQYQNKFFIT